MSALIEAPSILPDLPPSRRPRRGAVKPSDRTEGQKVKSTICLPLEVSRRLTVYAAMTGADRSEVVAQLIREHLRRFVVQDRAKSSGQDDSTSAV
jgi:hypothetical protein